MFMFKYCFYILLLTLLIDCNNRSRTTGYPFPGTSNTQEPPGQCFLGLMNMSEVDSKNYETFLAEAPYFVCGKSGGKFFVNRRDFFFDSNCKNWTGAPNVALTFDLKFTKIQKLQITPRHQSRTTALAMPVIFRPTNALIHPQNEDKGWNARIPPVNSFTSGDIELYCKRCDFNKNEYMSIQLRYRDQPVGSFNINPKATIARCQSTTNPSYAYPQ